MPEAFALPKISVITTSFNSAETIELCLKSVAAQTYLNKEHLIIDGNSKDETVNIINRYQKLYDHIRVVSEPDEGIYDAMNKGIANSTGEWLFFMGSDDEMFDANVLTVVFGNNDSQNYDIIYGNIQHKNSGKKFDNEFTPQLLARFNIAHQAIFYRKSIFNITGKFDTRYFPCADYAINIQWFGNENLRKKYIRSVVCIFNEAGRSFNYFDKAFNREKLILLDKYLKLDKPVYFTDAARHVIYEQLRNGDVTGALANMRRLFKRLDPGFNKILFLKECTVLFFQNLKATLTGKTTG
jgi:glycosyltransferase involved in cell wall biosynthesis